MQTGSNKSEDNNNKKQCYAFPSNIPIRITYEPWVNISTPQKPRYVSYIDAFKVGHKSIVRQLFALPQKNSDIQKINQNTNDKNVESQKLNNLSPIKNLSISKVSQKSNLASFNQSNRKYSQYRPKSYNQTNRIIGYNANKNNNPSSINFINKPIARKIINQPQFIKQKTQIKQKIPQQSFKQSNVSQKRQYIQNHANPQFQKNISINSSSKLLSKISEKQIKDSSFKLSKQQEIPIIGSLSKRNSSQIKPYQNQVVSSTAYNIINSPILNLQKSQSNKNFQSKQQKIIPLQNSSVEKNNNEMLLLASLTNSSIFEDIDQISNIQFKSIKRQTKIKKNLLK